jgi:hypothetical protein
MSVTIRWVRIVPMEFATCRSGRTGRASRRGTSRYAAPQGPEGKSSPLVRLAFPVYRTKADRCQGRVRLAALGTKEIAAGHSCAEPIDRGFEVRLRTRALVWNGAAGGRPALPYPLGSSPHGSADECPDRKPSAPQDCHDVGLLGLWQLPSPKQPTRRRRVSPRLCSSSAPSCC